MSFEALQSDVAERFLAKDRESGHRFLATVLVEECGELAEAARKDDLDAVGREACDVAFMALSLANLAGVDVEAAVRAKFLEPAFADATRTWTDVPWRGKP